VSIDDEIRLRSVDVVRMSRANSSLTISANNLRIAEHSFPVGHRFSKKASDDDLLEAYLDFVRSLRNQDAGNVWLRNDDLCVLATVLGRTADAVRADLEGRMAVQRYTQARLRTKRRRAAFAAFGVAVVGSALVVAQPGRATGSVAAAPRIGSAVTIERTVDRQGNPVIIEVTSADTSADSAEGVELGPSQVISRV
jgi:hypothetical protein